MKFIKKANGKVSVRFNREEWLRIGKQKNWLDKLALFKETECGCKSGAPCICGGECKCKQNGGSCCKSKGASSEKTTIEAKEKPLDEVEHPFGECKKRIKNRKDIDDKDAYCGSIKSKIKDK